jgi:hypothetical protein
MLLWLLRRSREDRDGSIQGFLQMLAPFVVERRAHAYIYRHMLPRVPFVHASRRDIFILAAVRHAHVLQPR